MTQTYVQIWYPRANLQGDHHVSNSTVNALDQAIARKLHVGTNKQLLEARPMLMGMHGSSGAFQRTIQAHTNLSQMGNPRIESRTSLAILKEG